MTALGIFIGGLLGVVAPELVRESAPSLVLPEWVLLAFNICWMVGGGTAFVGMVRGIVALHMPGMALIAGGLISYWAIIATIRGWGALTAVFILLLGIGCGLHAAYLYFCGYAGVERR